MPILVYVTRRPKVRIRPKLAIPPAVIAFPWKKLLGGAAPRKPWTRFYRPKRLAIVPAAVPAAALIWRKPPTRFKSRRLPPRFFRPGRRPLAIVPAAGPPPGPPLGGGRTQVLYYTSRRLRRPSLRHLLPSAAPSLPQPLVWRRLRPRLAARRLLARLFRPRHLLPLAPPPSPPPGQPFGGGRTAYLYYRSRGIRPELLSAHRKLRLYAIAGSGPPPPPGPSEWIIRHRRRGRR